MCLYQTSHRVGAMTITEVMRLSERIFKMYSPLTGELYQAGEYEYEDSADEYNGEELLLYAEEIEKAVKAYTDNGTEDLIPPCAHREKNGLYVSKPWESSIPQRPSNSASSTRRKPTRLNHTSVMFDYTEPTRKRASSKACAFSIIGNCICWAFSAASRGIHPRP